MGKLTPERIVLLKREMNFLMWTNDPPKLPPGITMVKAPTNATRHAGGVNMQCVSHAYVTAALLRGYPLKLFKGRAFVADAPNECLNEIALHYWISFEEPDGVEGFADFSLHGESEPPAVFGYRCMPKEWGLNLAHDTNELGEMLNESKRHCVYFPISRQAISIAEIHSWMNQPFLGAYEKGFNLGLGKIFAHCNRLLLGRTESLAKMDQRAAWEILAQEPPVSQN